MILVMSWFCLRMHAGYRCRHAGVCCHANWEIPVESQVVAAVQAGALRRTAAGRVLLAELASGADLHVPRHVDGACMFFAPSASGSCAIHRETGEAALPSACRHFPRELLIDARGTLVSLSHYCPTAAERLSSVDALEVVDGSTLMIGGPLEGLDATAALPPLLRPGVLTDLDGYAAWERAGLQLLANEALTAREALAGIDGLTERVRRWSPGTGTLADAVRAAGSDPPSPRSGYGVRPGSDRGQTGVRPLAACFAALVAQHISEEWLPIAHYEAEWQPLVEGNPEVERVARNYLGARLFANWIAYQGRGLRTVGEWLRACHAVFCNELALRLSAVRPGGAQVSLRDLAIAAAGRADLLLVHTIDSHQFADFFVATEQN